MADGSGIRHNSGKIRYDLVPSFAQEQYAKVLTAGAAKYGDNNWKKGMSWTTVLASLERHLAAIKKGEDYDEETGLLHSAHIMCNAGFLTEYYHIYPHGDNRLHTYLLTPRVMIWIDSIIFNLPNCHGKELSKEQLDGLEPLISPKDISFVPWGFLCPYIYEPDDIHYLLNKFGFGLPFKLQTNS